MSFRYADETDRPMIDSTIDRARWLEKSGFSFLTFMDHMWQLPGNGRRDERFLDCYTTLPAVARETETIELGGLVTCPHYRNPAYLARVIASLDQISSQRIVLGIGSGWYGDEYEAMNLSFPDVSTRNRQMRETIELCRELWYSDSPVSFQGEHYEVSNFYCEPGPERKIPILIGGAGEQLTLRATAEYADRWNIPFGDPDTYAKKLDVLHDHCNSLGRNYDAIEKTIANVTILRDDAKKAHEVYEERFAETKAGPKRRAGHKGAVGTPGKVRELLTAYESIGVDMYMLKVPANDRRTVELFVDEVMPAFE